VGEKGGAAFRSSPLPLPLRKSGLCQAAHISGRPHLLPLSPLRVGKNISAIAPSSGRAPGNRFRIPTAESRIRPPQSALYWGQQVFHLRIILQHRGTNTYDIPFIQAHHPKAATDALRVTPREECLLSTERPPPRRKVRRRLELQSSHVIADKRYHLSPSSAIRLFHPTAVEDFSAHKARLAAVRAIDLPIPIGYPPRKRSNTPAVRDLSDYRCGIEKLYPEIRQGLFSSSLHPAYDTGRNPIHLLFTRGCPNPHLHRPVQNQRRLPCLSLSGAHIRGVTYIDI
jgi:hypothetical protein